MGAPDPDYLAAARACFDLTGYERVLAKAEENGHLTDELRAQLEPIGKGLAAVPANTSNVRRRCTACGHEHAGEHLAGICIGCDCTHRGGAR